VHWQHQAVHELSDDDITGCFWLALGILGNSSS